MSLFSLLIVAAANRATALRQSETSNIADNYPTGSHAVDELAGDSDLLHQPFLHIGIALSITYLCQLRNVLFSSGWPVLLPLMGRRIWHFKLSQSSLGSLQTTSDRYHESNTIRVGQIHNIFHIPHRFWSLHINHTGNSQWNKKDWCDDKKLIW